MDGDGHHHRLDLSPVLIALFGIMAGAVVVAAYQCIVGHSCRGRGTTISNPDQTPRQNLHQTRHVAMAGSSVVGTQQPSMFFKNIIKEFKEGNCAVCLSEFNEGEEIRVLPECGHAFHAACVDMWLFSHNNCPLCRVKTDRSQHVIVVPMESSSGNSPTGIDNI